MTITSPQGRPRTRADVTLNKVIQTRVSVDELDIIKIAAEAEGLTVSRYVRTATLDRAKGINQ